MSTAADQSPGAAISESPTTKPGAAGTLLLTEGTPDLSRQILHAQWARSTAFSGDPIDHSPLYVCRVDPAGSRETLPDRIRYAGPVGCILVQTYTLNEARNGELRNGESFILFRDQEEFRYAWSIARRLAKATRGNPASLESYEVHRALFSIINPRHPYILDGGDL